MDLKKHANNLSLFWTVTVLVMISSFIPKLVSYRETQSLKDRVERSEYDGSVCKHAKIQRQINKIQDELSDTSMSKNFFEIKLKLFSYVILYGVTGLAMMYISWTYKYVPLLVLNPNLFYPFGTIISFPTGIEGAIGIVPWIAITTTLSKRFNEFLTLPHTKSQNSATNELENSDFNLD